MQEYAIDRGIRRKVTIILFTLAILITLLIRSICLGIMNFDKIHEILSYVGIDEIVSALGILPDLLSIPVWYGILWLLYDKFLWKKSIMQKFHHVPNIEGDWSGELISSYDDTAKHSMTLIIKQTWSHIHFTAKFDKSKSESNVAAILSEDTGQPVIYFGFQNRSKDREAHQQIYDGYNRIDLDGNVMNGRYSNDRPSNDPNKKDGNCGVFKLIKDNKS